MAGQKSNSAATHRKPKAKPTRKNFIKQTDSNHILEPQHLEELLNDSAITIDTTTTNNNDLKLKVKTQKRSPPKNIITNLNANRFSDRHNTSSHPSDEDDWKSLPSSAASSFTPDPFSFSKLSVQNSVASSPTPSLARPSLLSSLLRNNPIPPIPADKTSSSPTEQLPINCSEYGINNNLLVELSDSLKTSLIHDHQYNGLFHKNHGHQTEWRSRMMS
ncbi:hypothetical protein CONCODRAFT_76823 [Conidiobolus coronatus NRRL 28638]|uniref:Uncharacterized protein n=1 Tax=Conidiobolus coronatus (strain ATCC 28846 / CBS 209.66 / NRRL 28638) TaxID=796925 RepID=A0A137PHZ4_CONC2|nr:hypothetical protein CONCODRAFT_76823 [Conidiobolus coronatus NRRL 28638]|eukprot:KXN74612.1 hypothetical protein CONCODRAFT_76823 [Conidiobolus coronatus NRRL 28638]